MLSYQIYKLTHFLGIFLTLMALGGMAFVARQSDSKTHPWRKAAGALHGIGLFLVLLGGFGMLARLGLVTGLPGWIHAKLGLWVILGGLLFFVKRRQAWAGPIWLLTVLIAVAAAYFALYKPF